jgi:hypothetical protein
MKASGAPYSACSHVFAVIVSCWIRVFGRKAVPNADDCDLAILRDPVEHEVLIVLALQNPTTTVDVVEDRFWRASLGSEDTAWNLTARVARRYFYVPTRFDDFWFRHRGFPVPSHPTILFGAHLCDRWLRCHLSTARCNFLPHTTSDPFSQAPSTTH